MNEKSDQSSKGLEMSASAEVPDLLWRAFPPGLHDNRKSWLCSVARALGWNQRRVRALFYLEARVVTADEWRTLNERLDAAKNREKRADELRALHRDLGAAVPLAAREHVAVALPLADGAALPRRKREAGRPVEERR